MAKPQNVAIVADWLVGGGAEKVVLELHRIFPDAPVYTSYCTPEWRERLGGTVTTGWLQRLGGIRKFIPMLRARWFEHLDLSAYDLVISVSGNGESNHIMVPENTLHVNYCNAPTHFYFRHYLQYLREPGFGVFDPLARIGLRLLVGPLRRRDFEAAQRPDYIIANSTHIQSEIREFYKRESAVIHPPVDTKRFIVAAPKKRQGYVTMGRQTPYKKTDLIIEACNQLGLPLTVIGRGPEHERLQALAGPTVVLKNNVSDDEMPLELASAEGFIFAAYEDFGIAPVEAMAAGLPVLAYNKGGAGDYVVRRKTGDFFEEQTVESLVSALRQFRPGIYKPADTRAKAAEFSNEAFARKILGFIGNIPGKAAQK